MFKLIRLFIIPLVCSFLTTAAVAQSTSAVSGQVKSATGQPLSDAAVTIQGTNAGAYTKNDGRFRIGSLRPGKYTLIVSMLGYTRQEQSIQLGNTELKIDIVLAEETQTRDGVTVIAKGQSRQLKESGFAVNAIDTRRFANSSADMNTILNRTTGVKVRESGGVGSDFHFSINGLSGRAVRYFIDGIPMEVMGSSMTLNNVPVNLAERVEIYKGVLPVSLGADALGGAVNLVTNQNIKNYLDASYSFGSFNTHRAAVTGQVTGKKTGIVGRVSAFLNYSDNDYKMKAMEIYNDQKGEFELRDVRRFHDQYRSSMVQGEIGVANKKWADVFFIGAGYSNTGREIQTGSNQDKVYGEARQDGDALNATLRYKKNNLFTEGLDFNFFASHTRDKYLVTDTTMYGYFWDGSRVELNQAEINKIKTLTHVIRPRNYARANLSYNLNAMHSFNLNYTFDETQNETYNELVTDKDDNPGKIGKQIVGLSYQQNLFNGRWTNTFFGKYYGMQLKQDSILTDEGKMISGDDSKGFWGYGVASRYKIMPDFGVKASFEKAYRLPEVSEMFGNGYDQIANPNLKPESSNNLNVGAYYGTQRGDHRIYAEGGWYLRNAVDFIYAKTFQSNSQVIRYENTSKVKVQGVEGEVQYDYRNLFHLTLNATYQNSVNNTSRGEGKDETEEASFGSKIPNMPWLFGNALASLGKNDLLGKNTRLQLNWDMQYVHWFYLTWSEFGTVASNKRVPNQYIQNLGLTYSLQNGKYNITAECRNFTDQRAYDNYRLQKPGRAFYVKLRYFIH
ncbi:TonB-dependent receptor [Chitinophaga sp.]|uniref:TonB-dependent receptor n=1 Tax=Chitinophaga sp. TaxID=1869181 RepID=UPI00261957E6|nr:TonB-dependent receptor [uncultured Chitinophaga sp.]